MNAHEHFEQGNLGDAVTAALDDVKRNPTNSGKRSFLCELLCLTGDLERADKQLDALGQQDPQVQVGVSLFRQLIRAEQARQQFYSQGRLPEFLDQAITPELARYLEASILMREGKTAEASAVLTGAEEQRSRISGICNGQPFDDLRDMDDMTASFFEVLTSTGKYFWIPFDRVESVEFRALERPRDLLWRRAHMIVRGGPDGEVYLPVLYAGTAAVKNDQVRLGRTTEWSDAEGAPVRGLGQRIFLVGEGDRPILELETLSINAN